MSCVWYKVHTLFKKHCRRIFSYKKNLAQKQWATERRSSKKMAHGSMKRIACGITFSFSSFNNRIKHLIYFPICVTHKQNTLTYLKFHLAFQTIQMCKRTEGERELKMFLSNKNNEKSRLVWHEKKTRFSHLKSSAFEFYLNAKQKRFRRILTMTFSISIFLIVMHGRQ